MDNKRSIVLYIAMTLDGFIADKNGQVDWLDEIEGEGDNGYSEFYETVDSIIMGRRTYDQVLGFGCEWPYLGKKCYVFTNREYETDSNVQFVSGDITGFLSSHKSEIGSKCWLVGGAGIIDSFLKEGLIDQYIIAMIPIILGSGIPLFKGNNPLIKLVLKEQKQYKDIVLLHYVVKK